MKRKELSKTIYDDFEIKKWSFGLYKHFQRWVKSLE